MSAGQGIHRVYQNQSYADHFDAIAPVEADGISLAKKSVIFKPDHIELERMWLIQWSEGFAWPRDSEFNLPPIERFRELRLWNHAYQSVSLPIDHSEPVDSSGDWSRPSNDQTGGKFRSIAGGELLKNDCLDHVYLPKLGGRLYSQFDEYGSKWIETSNYFP